jgi:Protein of unknown function (DUF2490)
MNIRPLLFFLILSSQCLGQQWMNWNEGSFCYSPNKIFNVSAGTQYRWNITNQTYSKALFSAKINMKVVRFLGLRASYRRTWMPNEYYYLDQNAQTYGHRFSVGFHCDFNKFKKNTKEKRKWNIQYSSSYQWEIFKFKRNQVFWRNQIELTHILPWKNCKPYYTIESFYRTNQGYTYVNDQIQYSGLINEIRYSMGLKIAISKNHEFSIGVIRRDYQTQKWDANVIEMGYQHHLSNSSKSPKKDSDDR